MIVLEAAKQGRTEYGRDLVSNFHRNGKLHFGLEDESARRDSPSNILIAVIHISNVSSLLELILYK